MKRTYVLPTVFGTAALLMLLYFNLLASVTFEQLSGGLSMLDTSPQFSTEQLFEYRNELTLQAKTYYLQIQLLDMVFPLLYTLFFITEIRALTHSSRLRNMTISVATAGAACDYAENLIIRGFLNEQVWTESLTGVLGAVTCAKFALIASAVTLIIGSMLRNKRATSPRGRLSP
jgi:hypothetical protein